MAKSACLVSPSVSRLTPYPLHLTGNDRSSGLSTPINSISAGALPHLTPRDSMISRRSDSALPYHNHSSTVSSNCHPSDEDPGLGEGGGGGGGEDDSTDAAGVDVAAALPEAT